MRFYIDWLPTPEQRAALIAADIDFCEVSLGSAVYHRHGLAFPQEVADAVATELGLLRDPGERAPRVETPGGGGRIPDLCHMPLIRLPTPSEPVTRAPSISHDWFQAICREHYTKLGLGMVLNAFDWDQSEYRLVPGVLFINFRSNPVGMNCQTDEGRNIGRRLVLPRRVSRDYIRITGSDREVLALFRGDVQAGTLWFLFNPRNGSGGDELVDYVLSVVERHLHPELGEPLTYVAYREMGARRRYLRNARECLESEENEIDDRVQQADGEVREVRQKLVRALREASAARRRREVLSGTSGDALLAEFVERLDKEFDALVASPDFESIDFDGEDLKVQTRPITIEYQDRAYQFGRYMIGVGKENLSIASVDNVYASDDSVICHPHVTGDGYDVCLGNIEESVTKLQASMQFQLLLPLLLRYLEAGYNPSDSYARVDKFNNVVTRDLEVTT